MWHNHISQRKSSLKDSIWLCRTRVFKTRDLCGIIVSNSSSTKRVFKPRIYILLKVEAQRLMLQLSCCATSAATSFFFFFSFLKYNLSCNFKMVFTIFSPINAAHYLFIYFHYHPIINPAHYLFIYFHYHPIINLYN